MKKTSISIISTAIIICFLLSLFSLNCFAAGTTKLSPSKSNIKIGDTVTVTATFSSTETIYGVLAMVAFDSKILTYTSDDDNEQNLDQGMIYLSPSATGKSVSIAMKFKAKAAGSCKIEFVKAEYDGDSGTGDMSASSTTVTVTNPSTAVSSNANLLSLSTTAGTMVPKFSPNVTEYNVTVPYSVTQVLLNYTLADKSAKLTVEGDKFMEVGYNKRTAVVTAENGTVKRYVVNIVRLDESGNIPAAPDTPVEEKNIEIPVGDKTFYIDEKFTEDIIPAGFTLTEFSYNGTAVPAISDGEYTLLRLVSLDGSEADFYVASANGKFERLIVLKVGEKNYLIFTPKGHPKGYSLESDTIEGLTVPVYISKDPAFAKHPLIFAKGPGGETCFYRYDKLDGTIQRVLNEEILLITGDEEPEQKEEQETNILAVFEKLTLSEKIITIVVLSVIILLIAAIVILIVKIATPSEKSIAKKQKKAKQTEQDVLEDPAPASFDFVSVADMQENIEDSFDITEETDEPAAEEIAQPEEEEETQPEETESDSNDDEPEEETDEE